VEAQWVSQRRTRERFATEQLSYSILARQAEAATLPTAERYGLITGVYAPEALRAAAVALAERIATRAPLSVEAVKRTARRAPDLSPDEANAIWGEEQRVLRASNDHKAAVAAFRERRDPVFTRS